MKFLDLCAGIGGFRSGLEQAGHECVGYVEIDKYARKSYEAMYDTKGEWTREDITKVNPDDIPKSDCWCFGFPCQDISIAGRQKGLNGSRSGIFYDIINLLESQRTQNKPEWLLIENVKNLLSIDKGEGFTEVLTALDKAGYDCEWSLFNSKDFGVPQNRERVFIVGHLRERGRRQILSESTTGEQDNQQVKQIIPGNQAHRVYDSKGLSVTIKAEGGGVGAKTGLYTVPTINTIQQGKYSQDIILKEDSLSRSLMSRDYKGAQNVAVPKSDNQYGVFKHEGKEYNIRRLTPRECFRLQGFSDEQFDKAQTVNSDTQLYKQAGNAVTVNVARYLGELIKEV